MGRSRGGLTTKIHAVVDALGLPIKLSLSEGQAYDGHQANFC
jgi:transposase